jgi:diguanylate cyclase
LTAVVLIDLDRFKYVNDTLGHDVGDELLVEVARRLTLTLRDADVVARLGQCDLQYAVRARGLRDHERPVSVTPCETGLSARDRHS